MSERDVAEIWEYVDPESIAEELLHFSFGGLAIKEAAAAGEAVSQLRVPLVMDAMRSELARRGERNGQLLASLGSADVIDLEEMVDDDEYWFVGLEDVKDAILADGRFVNFTDFMLAQKQVRTSSEYVTNVFHTLVLFFMQDQPDKQEEISRKLRYQQSNQSWSNPYAPTHRFFLCAEALIPYSAEKVEPENKIPGIGRVGRRLMRAVLFDNEDIDALLLAERQRFDRRPRVMY